MLHSYSPPHSPSSSTAEAVTRFDSVETKSAREVELDSPVNEHGFREAVSQAQVHRLLERVGVVPRLTLADLQPYDGILAEIQGHAAQSRETASVYCFKGCDVPALMPPVLGSYPVWYLRLPDDMARFIPQLLQSALGANVGYTANPWVLANYIQITLRGVLTANDGKTASPQAFLPVGVEFCADSVNEDIHLAADKGCVLVIFECAGQLTMTGYALDDETIFHMQAAEGSTFFNPSRMEPWHELQSRARAVEDTGRDPQASGGVSVRIQHVYDLNKKAAEEGAREHARRDTPPEPGLSSTWMDSAGVGRLAMVAAYVPTELRQDPRIGLRNTVTPALFQSLGENQCQARVARVRLADAAGDAFVVVVWSRAEMAAITLKTDDVRFCEAYDTWAATGECPLTIENAWNGRLFALPLPWPRDFIGTPDAGHETAAELRLRLSQRALGDLLHEDREIRDMLQRMAVGEGQHLTCGLSEAIDEVEWAANVRITW